MGYDRTLNWDLKGSREYDGISEKSYTCEENGAVAVMCFADACRGGSHYITLNGIAVGYAVNFARTYDGASICFASFNVKKGDVIRCKPYASDTNRWNYMAISLFK